MNSYFTLLPYKIENTDFTIFKGDLYFTYKEYGLSYFTVKNLESLRKLLPKQILSLSNHLIKFVEIEYNSNVPPHKDYGGLNSSINFYFNPGDAKIIWYTAKSFVQEEINDEKHTRLYNEEHLNVTETLVAEPNSFYLFNNSQIHSVHTKKNNRQFIQIQFNDPYEKILDLINISN